MKTLIIARLRQILELTLEYESYMDKTLVKE